MTGLRAATRRPASSGISTGDAPCIEHRAAKLYRAPSSEAVSSTEQRNGHVAWSSFWPSIGECLSDPMRVIPPLAALSYQASTLLSHGQSSCPVSVKPSTVSLLTRHTAHVHG